MPAGGRDAVGSPRISPLSGIPVETPLKLLLHFRMTETAVHSVQLRHMGEIIQSGQILVAIDAGEKTMNRLLKRLGRDNQALLSHHVDVCVTELAGLIRSPLSKQGWSHQAQQEQQHESRTPLSNHRFL